MTASLTREATLAAQPASVAAARRLVRETLAEASIDADFADDVLLATSELVANAVLHAGGPVRVRLLVTVEPPASVRIEVGDESPVLPSLREYEADASTGRGLALVARLASRWGIEAAPAATSRVGKLVWCELRAADDTADRPDPLSRMAPPALVDGPDAKTVHFLGVPVDVYLRLQEQNDGVLRELALLAFTADLDGEIDPSPELLDVIARSRQYFNVQREGFRREVGVAAAAGEVVIDLSSRYSPSVVLPAADYVDLFERAEELAGRDEMLIAPAEPVVAKLRRWFIAEMSAQLLEKRPPQPFDPSADLSL
jgi:anti-sigma regulatory factor (Ser/Thr protein kinase)